MFHNVEKSHLNKMSRWIYGCVSGLENSTVCNLVTALWIGLQLGMKVDRLGASACYNLRKNRSYNFFLLELL